jgi:hypothetical protein
MGVLVIGGMVGTVIGVFVGTGVSVGGSWMTDVDVGGAGVSWGRGVSVEPAG